MGPLDRKLTHQPERKTDSEKHLMTQDLKPRYIQPTSSQEDLNKEIKEEEDEVEILSRISNLNSSQHHTPKND